MNNLTTIKMKLSIDSFIRMITVLDDYETMKKVVDECYNTEHNGDNLLELFTWVLDDITTELSEDGYILSLIMNIISELKEAESDTDFILLLGFILLIYNTHFNGNINKTILHHGKLDLSILGDICDILLEDIINNKHPTISYKWYIYMYIGLNGDIHSDKEVLFTSMIGDIEEYNPYTYLDNIISYDLLYEMYAAITNDVTLESLAKNVITDLGVV